MDPFMETNDTMFQPLYGRTVPELSEIVISDSSMTFLPPYSG
ncbi:unnamed protein product [Staurois parvus]|uniref:Uncharacterized protein n=1 Tax=Staurois parvus TaxID=386267 RepID=A0ABN9CKB9_9NEOB|nr:unnamed protein product [Staurois parvus]